MKFATIPAACLALLATGGTLSFSAHAADGDAPPAAPFSLFGDALEAATGIKAMGYLQLGFSRNNTSSHDQSTAGHSNLPVVGPADEGLQINALQVALERPITTNILPRITPLPGPMPWEFSWGFRAELLYGRNGLPASMIGYDADWGVNRAPDGVAPGSNRQNYVAMPQVYAQMYFPVLEGMALTVGRFGSGVGHEIPPAWRPGPNFFYSRTYAFVSQPDQVAGLLFSANLMRNALGLVAGELGVVNGRQNWKDNNHDKSLIGAIRWRSGDMSTWVDYSFMRGNEQNDMTVVDAPQMPISRIISPRGQLRQHHSLSVTLHPLDRVEASAEIVYGKQSGDGQPGTIDVITFNPSLGNFYTGASYSGLNLQLSYTMSPQLKYGVRAETFRDRGAIALFPVSAVPSDFNAVTVGLVYDINANLVFRPELRYDWQSHNNGVNAFGGGTASRQTTLSADLVFHF